MAFYTGVDQERYEAGEKFLPQNRFLLNYTPPETNVEEEEVTTSYGIPNTNAFVNSGGSSEPTTAFSTYKAQPYGSYVTNRTNYGNTGYLPGTEPEETYINKIGGLIKRGIGMAIPGGNFLMNMAENQARGNRLSATDNAFIDMQLANQEQSMHGGNLTNQDRYGYNKVSMLGNYAELVSKHAAKAKNKNPEDLTDFDKYYMEKEKEQEDINKQIDFNNFVKQRITANKLREQEELGIDLYPDGGEIHGGDDTTTTTTTTSGSDDGPGSWGGHGSVEAYDKSQEETYARAKDRLATGGRVGFFKAGLAGGDEISPGTSSKGGLRHGSGGTNDDGGTAKKINISPVIESKWSDLGFTHPTGVVGFDTSTPIGRLRATLNLKNYAMGDDVEPTLDYQGNIGPVDLNATYSDDVQNINASINKNNWNAGINYDAITGEPTFGINYSKTFKHGGLARLL